MNTLLIENMLQVVTMNDHNEEFSGGHILIGDGVIQSIGPGPAPVAADEVIDASGMVVTPGLINTHHHLFQSLTRNIPLMQDLPLFSWLSNHHKVWRGLDREAVHVSAQTALLELMAAGVTTSSDHLYLFPSQAAPDLIDAEIEAARAVGIRFQPTRGSMSLGKANGGLPPDDIVQDEATIQADSERLVRRYHQDSAGAMLRISLAPCSPFSVTPMAMRWTADYARDHGLQVHTHLAETLDEEAYCRHHYGQRPVALMQSLDWLTDYAWFAHCVHLNAGEIHAMAEAGAGVSHCPSSNMRLGSGIAPVRELLDAGVRVGLGVDGSASNDSGDMLLEMRNALLLSRLRGHDQWLGARDVLRMATRGGGAVLGRDDIGQLSVGKQADLALFAMADLGQAGGLSDPIAALVFTTRKRPVDYLIIQGRPVIREGRSAIDQAALANQHNRIAADLLKRARRHTGIDYLANASSTAFRSMAFR